jgi:hypothetical protein
MKTLLRLVVMVLLIVGWSLAIAAVHVVRGPDALTIIPKHRLGLGETYLDTRSWTIEDVSKHPSVVARLLELDKAEVLSHIGGISSPERLQAELQAAVEKGSTAELTSLRSDWTGKLPDIRF